MNKHCPGIWTFSRIWGVIINYEFYKWAMIINLVIIGVLRFTAETFFEYTNNIKIVNAVLYVIAIILMMAYLRKRFKVFKTDK
ncbi:hypothetical protein GCM10007063_27550 [Lentibacillus kapialis]|uniref:Uncharacterized protein n=1 Tax=Lentibacillus kapialis TaxID=340214 RepID=A0A917V092_9BACI|nr:hypothetical protein GCM10007063_27550 [Lentibacillus kapialis]